MYFITAMGACVLCRPCSRCGDRFASSSSQQVVFKSLCSLKIYDWILFIYFSKTRGSGPLHTDREKSPLAPPLKKKQPTVFLKCHLCHYNAALRVFQLHSRFTLCQTLLSLGNKPKFLPQEQQSELGGSSCTGDCKCPLDSFLLE